MASRSDVWQVFLIGDLGDLKIILAVNYNGDLAGSGAAKVVQVNDCVKSTLLPGESRFQGDIPDGDIGREKIGVDFRQGQGYSSAAGRQVPILFKSARIFV
ncbi:MAG: hypothetical protein ACOX1X_02935 [Dethiobacteria bacterium]